MKRAVELLERIHASAAAGAVPAESAGARLAGHRLQRGDFRCRQRLSTASSPAAMKSCVGRGCWTASGASIPTETLGPGPEGRDRPRLRRLSASQRRCLRARQSRAVAVVTSSAASYWLHMAMLPPYHRPRIAAVGPEGSRTCGTGIRDKRCSATRLAVLSHLGLVVAWHLFVKFGKVPKFVMPSPYDTLHALLVPNYRWVENITVTTVEIFGGYILAVVVGIGTGAAVLLVPLAGNGGDAAAGQPEHDPESRARAADHRLVQHTASGRTS